MDFVKQNVLGCVEDFKNEVNDHEESSYSKPAVLNILIVRLSLSNLGVANIILTLGSFRHNNITQIVQTVYSIFENLLRIGDSNSNGI